MQSRQLRADQLGNVASQQVKFALIDNIGGIIRSLTISIEFARLCEAEFDRHGSIDPAALERIWKQSDHFNVENGLA